MMALPAPLLDIFPSLEQIAREEDPRAPIEALIERTHRIEGILKDLKLDENFVGLERSVKAVGAHGQESIEEIIEQLQARESELAVKYKPMIAAARLLGKKVFRASHLSRSERSKHKIALERHEQALVSVLELYRDERWRMMALLSELRPATGDAPIFTSPEELKDYLDKL